MISTEGTRSINAPSILFGDTRITRLAWKPVIRKLWQASDPGELFRSLELMSLDENDAPIITYDMSPGWKTSDYIWHLSWINNTWYFPGGNGWTSWRKQHEIVLAGLEHPWYCMGMLQPGLNDLYFFNPEHVIQDSGGKIANKMDYLHKIVVPWLNGMLTWIEDVARYSDRLHYSYPGCDLSRFEGVFWMRNVFCGLLECGWIDWNTVRRLPAMSFAEAIDCILSCGRVTRNSDGRLCIAE